MEWVTWTGEVLPNAMEYDAALNRVGQQINPVDEIRVGTTRADGRRRFHVVTKLSGHGYGGLGDSRMIEAERLRAGGFQFSASSPEEFEQILRQWYLSVWEEVKEAAS